METVTASNTNLKVLNRDIIKYIAMFTMLLNHIAHILLPQGTLMYEVFEDIGYFTAPVMCFFMVEGYEYTKSKVKYGLRLLLFAVISQIPYELAFHYGNLNMIYTLLCCFLILVVMDKVHNPVSRMAICMVLLLATIVGDWPLLAPLYTIMLYNSKGNRKKTWKSYIIAYILFVLMNSMNAVYSLPGGMTWSAVFRGLLSGAGIIAAAVAVLVFYNGERARKGRNFSKWFFYIFYPAHLLILYLIKTYVITGQQFGFTLFITG